jgi:hypothetical protein
MPLSIGKEICMRRVISIFAASACFLVLALGALPAFSQLGLVLKPPSQVTALGPAGWVLRPPTGDTIPFQSNESVTLSGYVLVPGQTVTISAVDQNTGDRIFLGSTYASKSGSSYENQSYTLYPWKYETGELSANYWAPQQLATDMADSQGHLELFASVRSWCFFIRRFPCTKFLPTFSASALKFVPILPDHGTDPAKVFALSSDGGDATVLFDQYGVKGTRPSWTTVAGMISNPPLVAWSVGSYTVDGGKNIYALICAPNTPGQYPMVVYNHGGINYVPGTISAASMAT